MKSLPLHISSLVATAVVLFMSLAAHAQHSGDIFIGLDGNQLITGQIHPDQTIDTSVRVYRATFGDSGFDGFTANPGYDAALIFNPAFRIGFNLLSPLQYWNGVEPVNFGPTAGETLTLSFLSLEDITGECYVPGFDLAVQADGGWHRHLSMFLNPTAGMKSGTPGIYLLKMELYYTAPGYEDSPPYWIVFNHNDTLAHHDAAVAWVTANLASPSCPADVNQSGAVDVDDLIAVILGWGDACNTTVDSNDDGAVDVDDLIAVILAWGACP
jgi:hypothetical protein